MTTPTFPSYAKIQFAGYSQQRESALMRTEMESGPPRQVKVRSRVMLTRNVKIYLASKADFQSFESWYASTINMGASWFNFADPVSGNTVMARFVSGGYAASPLVGGLEGWMVDAKIESWG